MPATALFLAFLLAPPSVDCPLPGTMTTGAYVEARVILERPGVRLVGRLLVPNRPGPHPAVVILSGGGRGGQVNYTPRFIATRMARCGVAALVYDKRGTGISGGDWEAATFDDLVADAVAALAYLRRQPGIDGARVGLVGLSQGGRLAPAVAVRAGDIAFIATASAPFVALPDTRLYALDHLLRKHRYPDSWRAEALDLWAAYMDRRARDASTAPLDNRIRRFRYVPAHVLPPLSDQPLRTPFFNSIGHDYAGALRELDLPFLALYGTGDTQVPVHDSIQRLRALHPAPSRLDVRLVPGVDHAFRYTGDNAPRYRFEDEIIAWVLAQAGEAPCAPYEAPSKRCLAAMDRRP